MTANEYFLAALDKVLDDGKLKQTNIADSTGTAPQTINAIVRRRKAPGIDKQEEIANACGYTYIEFLQKGKEELEGKESPREKKDVSPGNIEPADIFPVVSEWIAQFQKNTDRMRFWRQAFDSLPVAALIIRDRVVYYQNQRSLEIGRSEGGALCDHCATKCCEDKANCPVTISMRSGLACAGYRDLGGNMYKVEVAPFRWGEMEYFLVTATRREDTLETLKAGEV